MAAALIAVRSARERESKSAFQSDLPLDDRPEYLTKFPNESQMLKDVKFGVLLGRYLFTLVGEYSAIVNENYYFPQELARTEGCIYRGRHGFRPRRRIHAS